MPEPLTRQEALNNCQPLLLASLCFALGIWSAVLHPLPRLVSFTGTLAAGSLACPLWLSGRQKVALFLAASCFFMLGNLRLVTFQDRELPASHISTLVTSGTEQVIVGRLAEMPSGNETSEKAVFDVHCVKEPESSRCLPTVGMVLISVQGKWPQDILPGDTAAIRAVIRQPPAASSTADFDYRSYLADRGIFAIGSTVSGLFIKPVTGMPPNFWNSLRYFGQRIRSVIKQQLDSLLPPDDSALYKALLIGDRSSIAVDTMESFKAAGIMHILAISGVHMALLGFLLYQAFFWLLSRSERLILTLDIRRLALLLCIPFLMIYALLAGGQPPVLRSLAMAIMAILALGVNRTRSPLTLLAGAALLLLVSKPSDLFNVSFQLSFTSVAMLILLVLPLTNTIDALLQAIRLPFRDTRPVRQVTTVVAVTVAATIGTLPLLLYHFNQISLVAVPANLIAEPIVCLWILPACFLALPFLFFCQPVASLLFKIGTGGLAILEQTASLLGNMSWSSLWLPAPPMVLVLLYYAFLFAALRPGLAIYAKRVLLASVLFLTVIFLLPLNGLSRSFLRNSSVSFIDVGHGNATLIELAGGRCLLVDAGGRSTPGFDVGARRIAPYLWQRGIARLDDIIISHADSDHYNGVPALIRRFHPKRLWVPYLNESKTGYQKLIQTAREFKVAVKVPDKREFIVEPSGKITALDFRQPGESGIPPGKEDDCGLVIRLQAASFSAILAGDISREREQQLVASGEPMAADLLLSPHHGSATSNSSLFLEAVKPDYLIVSTGDRSEKLFPAPATRATAARLAIPLLTTMQHGSITASATPDGYVLQTTTNYLPGD